MFVVFLGSDTVKVRHSAHTFAEKKRNEGYAILSVTSQSYQPGQLRENAQAASLFGERQCVILDGFSEQKETFDALLEDAPLLAESPHIFVALEEQLSALEKKRLIQHATEVNDITGNKPDRFNTFALADALLRRDKKSLWVLLQSATRRGISFEEIVGTLFWQIKAIRLAKRTRSADAAGLKPFVYKKACAASFSLDEADAVSRQLLQIYHDAHLGKVDGVIALESLILKL